MLASFWSERVHQPGEPRITARLSGGLVAAFALALLPLLAGAQPPDKISRIGYLSTAAGITEQTQIFLHRLRELG
jgi:hypothetical protein